MNRPSITERRRRTVARTINCPLSVVLACCHSRSTSMRRRLLTVVPGKREIPPVGWLDDEYGSDDGSRLRGRMKASGFVGVAIAVAFRSGYFNFEVRPTLIA